MKIMMTGGGTLGPVTPLLAVVEAWRREDPDVQFVWVGTKSGPERLVVEKNIIPFHGLGAPKLDRHAPLKWALIPFQLAWSLKMALHLLQKERPDAVVTAGGYVSVPVLWAAKLYGIPSWVHQLDVKAGIANLLMARTATKISCGWTTTVKKFPAGKTIHLGNPVRASVMSGSRERAAEKFGLDPSRPTVLAFGGGTGSTWLNHTVAHIAPELVRQANILHLTGIGKAGLVDPLQGYVAVELVKEGMNDVFALADLVVCRAGMGTISELSALRKAAIIIPIPDSQMEDNTRALEELNAAVTLDQRQTTPQILLAAIDRLLHDTEERRKLGARLNAALPTDGIAEKLAHHIKSIAKIANP